MRKKELQELQEFRSYRIAEGVVSVSCRLLGGILRLDACLEPAKCPGGTVDRSLARSAWESTTQKEPSRRDGMTRRGVRADE
jgi:hypothetical protein